jgi:epoxyqueuosine reductase
MHSDLKEMVVAEAREAGFDAVRITVPAALSSIEGERLRAFLDAERHGEMNWLAETAERRAHPLALWPETRSIIMLGKSYAPAHDPLEALADPTRGAISCYAHGKDYHDLVKSGLKRVARRLAEAAPCDVKVFVDTAPLMEKPLAQAAGLGWRGKHTNLVSREFGSWLFLGAILATEDLEPDAAEVDHCGSCSRCLDVCPTAAFPAPYQLDARRCIAYLTIEHKGHIPEKFRASIGNRVFGCDDCLAVCPWNKFAATAGDVRLRAQGDDPTIPLADLLELDDAAFRKRFAGTPLKRTGRDRVVRNALIAAGNSGDASLLPRIIALLDDASPLVRAMAVWAARRLAGEQDLQPLRKRSLAHERDGDVVAEWNQLEHAS